MAITNAQQYQQLVNKPANGKRPGYRGIGGYQSGRSAPSSSSSSTSSSSTAGPGDTGGEGGNRPSDQSDRQYRSDAPPVDKSSALQTYNTKVATGRLSDEDYETFDDVPLNKREQEFKDFLERRNKVKGFGFSKFFEKPMQKFSDFNASINRPFFENVIRAGKIPGLSFDATEEDFEKAYQNYMANRLSGKTDAYGNPVQGFSYDAQGNLTGNFIDNGGGDSNYIPPVITEDNTTEEDPTVPRNLGGLAPRFAGSIFDFTGLADGGRAGMMDGGMMEDTPEGGIMDLESGRQMYFLGKLVKKATRAVKKVVKSPLGKAALIGGLGYLGATKMGGLKGLTKFFGANSLNPFKTGIPGVGKVSSPFGALASKFGLTDLVTGNMTLGGKLALGLGVPFALDALGIGKEEDDKMDLDEYYRKNSINIADIRNNPYNFLAPRFAADGGLMRTGYAEGSKEPVAKETMPLIDMDGKEMDLREDGGFVPLGRMERADDVPARLSKNEFVFTADAVRNAGEGDIDKGAEVMYNMMKNLESGGEVSEESQGLDGAREMFKTSQRLEEVL